MRKAIGELKERGGRGCLSEKGLAVRRMDLDAEWKQGDIRNEFVASEFAAVTRSSRIVTNIPWTVEYRDVCYLGTSMLALA
ncbi:hypothetical protein V1477_020275 [Vespula maculifrons]|uniref:Uncharacterized protein n=2 Tax=Vespula TaxID=7451 RepID=A0A834P671_VESPE|nr:hypothetical protein H0235_006080 [Vespula pensylvanica]